jgi:phage terminase large subunit-like protein
VIKLKTNKVIQLSGSQMEFLHSSQDYTLFCGGVGSGKTHGGAIWALTMALKYPNTKGLITANSYSQLKKATLSKFFEILLENDIEYKYKSQDGIIEINGTTIYCISMEKYDLLRGIDEVTKGMRLQPHQNRS